MPRKPKTEVEMLELAEQVIQRAKDAHELRCAQAVFFPVRFGLTLQQTADAVGRARGTVVRLQAEFRARQKGFKLGRENWGGRRRQNLTLEQEEDLLGPFFEQASRGGVLIVAPIKRAYEEWVGHSVPDSTVYRVLDRHGWRKITPDRRHPKADPATQAQWKKNSKRI